MPIRPRAFDKSLNLLASSQCGVFLRQIAKLCLKNEDCFSQIMETVVL